MRLQDLEPVWVLLNFASKIKTEVFQEDTEKGMKVYVCDLQFCSLEQLRIGHGLLNL